MTYLLIDIGNTFMKWGRYDPPNGSATVLARQRLKRYGREMIDEIGSVAAQWEGTPAPKDILISNVAGTRVLNSVLHALEVWPDAPEPFWLISQPEQCGVRNGYLNPAALGCDRWAAMIGARAVVGPRAVLVVVCGTATTIDLVSADGVFLGGTIMPGLGLMQRSLHQNTATLPDAIGQYVDHPRQTVDAIATGCAHAQAGAVERLFEMHKGKHPDLQCVVSGGAARSLGPRLSIPLTYHDNLVLEGLYCIANSRRQEAKESGA